MASVRRAHTHLQSEAAAFPGYSVTPFCYPIPPTDVDLQPSSTGRPDTTLRESWYPLVRATDPIWPHHAFPDRKAWMRAAYSDPGSWSGSFEALLPLLLCVTVVSVILVFLMAREMGVFYNQLAEKSRLINALSIKKQEVDKENHLFSLKLDATRADLRESQGSTKAALAEAQGLTASLKAVQSALKCEQVNSGANQAKLKDLQAAFDTQRTQRDAAYKECDSLRAQLSEKEQGVQVLVAGILGIQVHIQQIQAARNDLQAVFDTQRTQYDTAYKECDSLRAQLSETQRNVEVLEAKISCIQADAQQARNTAFNECNSLREQLANRERSVQVLEARIAQLEQSARAREREVEEERRRWQAEREQERRLQGWRHATAEEVRRCHERDARWPIGTWNQARALERFHFVVDEFSKMEFKFSESRPLTAGSVPWPVLHHPQALRSSLDGVGWKGVEEFFAFAKASMVNDTGRYQKLLSTMQRTFHPDKWSAARRSVLDDDMRGSMEAAVVRVSQAINALLQ